MDNHELEEFLEAFLALTFMLPLFIFMIILGELGLIKQDYSPEIDIFYNSRSI